MSLRLLWAGIGFWLISGMSSATEPMKAPLEHLHGLGQVTYHKLVRQLTPDTSQTYHLYVRVPENPDPKQQYPTLFLLDGGTNFPLLSAYYSQLRFMEDVEDMILVGISYGTYNWQQGNARSVDFTAPSEEYDFWGGASDFDGFIAQQLMPLIEANYPADPSQHMLFGQSLGGQFGLFTTLYGQAPFKAVVAVNPALHRNLEFFKRAPTRKGAMPRLFVSSAANDNERFRLPALKWHAHWQAQLKTLQYSFLDLPGHNHLSANPVVFRWSMGQLLLPQSAASEGED